MTYDSVMADGLRCTNCGKKLGEAVDGLVVITCSNKRCRITNVFKSSVQTTAVARFPVEIGTVGAV